MWQNRDEVREMLSKGQELRRNVVECLTLEDQIPRNHLLRRIDEAINFGHLYDFIGMKILSIVTTVENRQMIL